MRSWLAISLAVVGLAGALAALWRERAELEERLVRVEERLAARAGARGVAPRRATGGDVGGRTGADAGEGDELEQRLAELEARMEAVERGGDRVLREADGELFLELSEAGVTRCAFEALEGIRTAEASHDAAFDAYGPLDEIGFHFVRGGSCHRYLAARVEPEERGYLAEVLVTRGEGRGRTFSMTADGPPREGTRLDEAMLVALLRERGWIGEVRE